MLGRQRASVEEGRVEGGMVDERNERDEARTAGWRKRAEEGLSEEGREQGSKGARGDFKGGILRMALASIFTNHPTTRLLPL